MISRRALLALIALQTVLLGWAASPRYFFADDFLYLSEAASRAPLEFMGHPYFGHFAPLHRWLFIVLQRLEPLSFPLAMGLMLPFHAASTWLLARVLARVSPAPINVVLITAFGTSLLFLKSLSWPSSGFQAFPMNAMVLLALDGFLAAVDVRLPEQRAASVQWGRARAVIGTVLGVLFFVKAIFLPLIAGLMLVCFARCRPTTRAELTRAAVALSCLVVPVFAFLVFYVSVADAAPQWPSGALWVSHGWRSLLETFFPMLLGYRLGDSTIGIALGAALFGVLAARALVTWKRSTSWPLAFFLASYAATIFLTGRQRLAVLGEDTWTEPRYVVDLLVPFAITTSVLFSDLKVSRVWALPALAAYLALFIASAPRVHHPWNTAPIEPYLRTLRAEVDRLQLEQRTDAAIFNRTVPYDVMPGWLTPHNQHAAFLAFLRPGQPMRAMREHMFAVTPEGRVVEPRRVDLQVTPSEPRCADLNLDLDWWLPGRHGNADAVLALQLDAPKKVTLTIHQLRREADRVELTTVLEIYFDRLHEHLQLQLPNQTWVDGFRISSDGPVCVTAKAYELEF